MEKQMQKLLPSAHLLELFMPLRNDEPRMLLTLQRAAEYNYYKGFELGVFFDHHSRLAVRRLIEDGNYHQAVFLTPYLKERKMNLCSLDSDLRESSVAYAIELAGLCADQGCINIGVPSGDDPGECGRKEAKKRLADSLARLSNTCATLGMNLTLEPLDRYVYKKQLIGPMLETVNWLAPLHAACPNLFLHWDSAHEALGKTDLMLSLAYAKPYIAQFHLCNAILDPFHPCFGDLHMDVGTASDFETEGFLTPNIGAKILRKAASFPKPAGVKNTYVSIEVLGHPGDDMWQKEKSTRLFLQQCFAIADIN